MLCFPHKSSRLTVVVPNVTLFSLENLQRRHSCVCFYVWKV